MIEFIYMLCSRRDKFNQLILTPTGCSDGLLFKLLPASVLLPDGFGLLVLLFRGLPSAPNVSYYSVWKAYYSFRFFTSSYILRNLIFHISFCFVNVIVRVAGSHATGLACLWSVWPQLIVNGEQMKEIFIHFMGIQAGPKPFLMPPFTVNVYWMLLVCCELQYLYKVRF